MALTHFIGQDDVLGAVAIGTGDAAAAFAQPGSPLAPATFATSLGTAPLSLPLHFGSLPIATPYQYGFPLTGTFASRSGTDATAAINACLAAGKICCLPSAFNTWKISGTITVPAGCAVVGIHGKAILYPQAGTYSLFKLTGDDAAVENLFIDNAAKTGGYDFEIACGTGIINRARISQICAFSSFGGIFDSGTLTTSNGFHVSTQVDMCQFRALRGTGFNFTRAFAFLFVTRSNSDFNGSVAPNNTGFIYDATDFVTVGVAASGGAIIRDFDVSGTAGGGAAIGAPATNSGQKGIIIKKTAGAWLHRVQVDGVGGVGIDLSDINKASLLDVESALTGGTPLRLTNINNSSFDVIKAIGRQGLTSATANVNGVEFVSGNADCVFSNVQALNNTGHGIAKLAAQAGGASITLSNVLARGNVGRGIYSRGDSIFSIVGGSLFANTAGAYDMTGIYDYLSDIIKGDATKVSVGPNPGVAA